MAQINRIEIKSRTSSGGTPSLTGGELALNRADGNLFYLSQADSVTKTYMPTQALNVDDAPTFTSLNLTSPLRADEGGTGYNTFAVGDLLYASDTTVLSKLAKGTALQTLQMNSGATVPEWAASTQSVLTTTGDILYASANNTLARLAKGAADEVLTMNSGATAPEWSAVSGAYPAYAGDLEIDVTAGSASGHLTFDAAGNIELNADGGYVNVYDGSDLFFQTAAPARKFKVYSNAASPSGIQLQDVVASGTARNFTLIPPTAMDEHLTWTLPVNSGSSGQVLRTDGSGTLSWVSAGSSNVSGLTDLSDVTYANGDLTITSLDTIVSGNLLFDSSGDLTFDADGGQFNFNDATATHFLLDCDNTKFVIYDDQDTGDLFQIQIAQHGATTFTTIDDDARAANLTITPDGELTLNGDEVTINATLSGSGDINLNSYNDTVITAGTSGAGHLTVASDNLTLSNYTMTLEADADGGATAQPVFKFLRSHSAANDDYLGRVQFGSNSDANLAFIQAIETDTTSSGEDASLELGTYVNGSMQNTRISQQNLTGGSNTRGYFDWKFPANNLIDMSTKWGGNTDGTTADGVGVLGIAGDAVAGSRGNVSIHHSSQMTFSGTRRDGSILTWDGTSADGLCKWNNMVGTFLGGVKYFYYYDPDESTHAIALSDVAISGSASDIASGTLPVARAPAMVGAVAATNSAGIAGVTPTPAFTDEGKVLSGAATYVENKDTTYSPSVVDSSGIKLRLTAAGTGSGDQDITFAGAGGASVARTSGSVITITSSDTNTQLSTEAVQDIVGAMFTSNTETRVAATYQDGDGTIDLVVDDMTANDNTWRTVTAGGNTLSTSETLAFTAGSNVTITESAGAVTIASADTNTQLSTEQVQDIVGAMFTSNTETRIAATYEDGDGTIDLVVDDMTANTNDDVSVANLKTRLAGGFGSNAVQIGDGDDVVTIPGSLVVTGTTTTNNVETVTTSGGVVFEGSAADANELTLKAGTVGSDFAVTLPSAAGTLARTADVAYASAISEGNSGLVPAAGSSGQFLQYNGAWATPPDTNTWRTVTAGGNTLSTSETLAFTAGTNVTITESGGAVTITSADTNTQLSTEAVQDIVGAMFTSNTETRIAATYEDGDGTIDLVVTDMTANDNTWRTVTAGGNTLSTSETLAFTAGTNIAITESGGAVTITGTDTNTTYTGGTNLTLSGTTFNVDDSFLKNDASDTTSGTITAAGFTTTGTWTFDEYTSGTIGITTVQDSGTTFNDNDTSFMTAAAINDRIGTIAGGGEANQNAWTTITVPSGTTTQLADTTTDTLAFTAAGGMTITGGADDTIQFSSSDTNTWRGVTAGGNTLASNETLAFTAGSNVTITESGGAVTIASADTNTQLSTEQVQDIVGAMFTSNTETRIAATYEDGDGTIDLVVTDMTANDNTWRTVTAGGNTLSTSETLAFTAGTGITISESAGAVTITNSVSDTTLSTENVQDIVGAMFTSNTETRIAATYEDGDGTIDLVVTDMTANDNTWRTVTAGGNTLSTSETLAFTAGSNVTITESAGAVTIASTDTNTTYSSSDFTHDDLTGFVANEHLDWTSSVGTIHSGNYTNTTYSVGDGGLTTNDFTNADHSKLNAIEASATADQTAGEILTLLEDGIDSVHYKNGSIDNDHIADDAINSEHYAANSIDTEHYAANSVDADALNVSGDGTSGYSLTSDGDGSFSWSNISSGGSGDMTGVDLTGGTGITIGSETGTTSGDYSATITNSGVTSIVAGSNISISGGTGAVTVTATDTNTQLSTEQVQDIVGAMFTSNTETRGSLTYVDGDGTIDLVVDDMTANDNTWRTVTAGGNTLSTSETLAFTAGSNVTITESAGAVTIAATDTDTTYSAGSGISLVGGGNAITITDEYIQDLVGAMFTSNTETRGSLTYQDGDGTIDLVVDDMSGGGVPTTITVADESSDTTCFPLFVTAASGDLAPKTGSNITFDSSAGKLTASLFIGPLTGNVTGNATGSSGSCTGNAATATALATARTIAGVSFDGTGNISLNNNAITNGAGYITSYTNTTYSAGSLLDLSSTTFNVDLSELTDGTGAIVGSQDELVYLDNGSQKRKLISEITLSDFSNDSGWTTNTGTTTASNSQTFTNKAGNISQWTNDSGYVTANTTYSAGSGLDLSSTTFSVDVSDFMTNGANNYLVTATGADGMNAEVGLRSTGSNIYIANESAADAEILNYGQLWCKDNGSGEDNTELWFTNDAGTDIQITDGNAIAGGGGGGGTPTDITVTDESSDTTCFVSYFTAATGNLEPKTGSNLTFNSSTGEFNAGGRITSGGTITSGTAQVCDAVDLGQQLSQQNSYCQSFSGGTMTFATAFSDSRLKHERTDYGYGIAELKQLTPEYFKFNKSAFETANEDVGLHIPPDSHFNDKWIGLMAQDVEALMPELVEEVKGYKAIKKDALIFTLINAVKELEARIATLEAA